MNKKQQPVHGSPYLPAPIAAVYEVAIRDDEGTVHRYIGESRNVVNRLTSLTNNLQAGSCHNARLQADYARYGTGRLWFHILDSSEDMKNDGKRKDREHRLILDAVAEGHSLYNVNLQKDDGKYWKWEDTPDLSR